MYCPRCKFDLSRSRLVRRCAECGCRFDPGDPYTFLDSPDWVCRLRHAFRIRRRGGALAQWRSLPQWTQWDRHERGHGREDGAEGFSFICATCGQTHVGMPDLVFDAPIYVEQAPELRRAETCALTSDTCVIENEHYFVRGCLEIPVRGRRDSFAWGVWTSLSRESFRQYQTIADSDGVRLPGPCFGWLANRIPGYPDTINLKTHVHLRSWPTRPAIELEPTGHPLAREQRHGIDEFRLAEILRRAMHPPVTPPA